MDLNLDNYIYSLPKDRIAKHPLKERGDSKLLLYEKGELTHHKFKEIDCLIPSDSLLVFNDTKVIPARIVMYKETGARIEIFLLNPLLPSQAHADMMNAKNMCTWECLIGNAKKWKLASSLWLPKLGLEVIRTKDNEVTFKWNTPLIFATILNKIGKIPLPPYISRAVEELDQERYQTVYSKSKGAVAAPTAGLHFTKEIISNVKNRGIQTDYLTLHVTASTFLPIKCANIKEHPMHNEQIWISKATIEKLLATKKIIAVGTTSIRTLESLYWYGVKVFSGNDNFFITKNDPYTLKPISKEKALQAVLTMMNKKGIVKIGGQTELFIYPGYQFKLGTGLITNYHLPGSTLMLLVAAYIGENWKKVYQEALKNKYRFLSYGDSSLLLP